MKKKHSALFRTVLIVGVLAVLSWFAQSALNPEINAEMPITVDVSKIGSVVLEKIGEIIRAFLSPERRSWQSFLLK